MDKQNSNRIEEIKNFDKGVSKLMNKYNVRLGVVLTPASFLAKLLKNFIKVQWRIIIIDNNQNGN